MASFRWLEISLFRFEVLSVILLANMAWGQTPGGAPQSNSRPRPTPVEEREMLLTISDYATRYVDSLPNFICDLTTHQFEAGRKAKKWHELDAITSKLVYSKGKEERSLEMVNGKPVSAKRHIRTPLTSEGEFGLLLREIFEPETQTEFRWSHWESANGHELAVFDFSVDKAHSTLKLTGEMGSGIAPFRGSVTADVESGEIWKVMDSAYDIPPITQTESIGTTISYDRVTIGDRSFLLPVRASVVLSTGEANIRNEMNFEGYRKFESDSKIMFSADDSMEGSAIRDKPRTTPNF